MTPEELNRTIDFIVQSQARLAAAQEQDRADRIHFEKWTRKMFTRMAVDRRQIIELIRIQSERLDRLDRILEKLTDRLN
jgi:hypothetical protein